MTIGEVAARCGLQASAIRYYERSELLPRPPRASGRRVYTEGIIHRIAFIQFARDAGFTIAEIKILANPASATKPLSARMRQLATRKVEEVDRLIQRANMMKDLLGRALRCQCIDTEECGRRILARDRK